MIAHLDLNPLILTAEEALFEAADVTDRYVTPERGTLTRADARRACLLALRQLRAASYCATTCAAEAWTPHNLVFDAIVEHLKRAHAQLGNALDTIEVLRFKRDERCADVCSALVCSMVALRKAKLAAARVTKAIRAEVLTRPRRPMAAPAPMAQEHAS